MGRPKKEQRDVRVVGYIPPKYLDRVLEILEDGYHRSISEIVTKGVIRFVDSYQKPKEEHEDESDRLKREALGRKSRKEADEFLHDLEIEEYEAREEGREEEAERAYYEEQDRRSDENAIRRLMRKGMSRPQAKEFIENLGLARKVGDITLEEAQKLYKEGKYMDYATIVKKGTEE